MAFYSIACSRIGGENWFILEFRLQIGFANLLRNSPLNHNTRSLCLR